VREITVAAQRAASLTGQLLAFSRSQVFEPKVVSLNDVVAGMSGLLRRLVGSDVNLTTTLDTALGSVKADPVQLEQVLMNFVVNARDAMPRGGRLHVGTANVTIEESDAHTRPRIPPGTYVRLAVTDTGVGMDEATRARIFEPFFTTKPPGRGTGLGLATVYGIVAQSGGHITVDTKPGLGSSFRVFLPRTWEAPTEKRSERPDSVAYSGGETILLVEDEPAVRTLIHHVLRAQGYAILETKDGLEARRLARDHAGMIDLLVADVVLPERGGIELAIELKAQRPQLRTLFISGHTSDAVERHGTDSGSEFLQKPFTPTTLARKVRAILDAPA
jgi:CheY-like chemotaxis protein